MSLQVWLPLNGDLHNQGLANITATNNGATINNNGKIGKCYSFGTSTSYLTLPKEAMTSFTNECSVCFWIKILSWNTSYATYFQAGLGSAPWSSYIFGLLRNNANSTCCFTISNGSTASNTSYQTPTLELNTWYHIGLCYKTGHCLIYINGQLYRDNTTTIIPNFSAITTITIGTCNTKNSYQTNCLMNDFRIYDHCLSDKEVEELAKGLILHYKLDGTSCPNQNLLQLIPKRYANTEYLAYQLNMTENLIAGQTYTLQLWDVDIYHSAKTIDKTGVYVFWGGGYVSLFNWYGSSSFIQTTDTNYHADYLIKTFTPTSAQVSGNGAENAWLNIYNSVPNEDGTKNMYIGAWKLEKGNIATPWNNDENIVYDSSGYNNDGIIVGGSISSDTIRHSTSTNFTNSQYIYVNKHCAEFLPKDAITVNLWQNSTSWAKPISCTERGGFNFEDNAAGMRFPVYMSGVGYKYTNSDVAAASLNGSWHMLTGTVDSENIKLYIDGELKTTTPTTTTAGIGYANNYLFIAAEASGNTTTPANSNYVGNISDVRIYATALTPEQILELYHTSATIDNIGSVYGREIIEDINVSITKQGQLKTNSIVEQENTQTSIIKTTNNINSYNFYEY